MKEKFFSYKTKHYLVKSIELSEEVKLIDLLTQVWTIYKKDSNEVAGTFNFNGPQKKGKVVLSYNFENIQEVDELELIFSYIVKWAFNQKDVYVLETAMPENKTYKQIFDFLAYKKFKENEVATFTAPNSTYLTLYLFIGFVLGIFIGLLTVNFKVSLIASMAFCFSIGFLIDSGDKKHRKEVCSD